MVELVQSTESRLTSDGFDVAAVRFRRPFNQGVADAVMISLAVTMFDELRDCDARVAEQA